MDDEAVPQDAVWRVPEEVLPPLQGLLEVCHGLRPAHKGDTGHIADALQPGLERPGRLVVVILIHVGQKLVLILQLPEHVVQVHRHQGEGAHDEKAGQDHTHRGKGHQPMGKDAPEAILKMIPKLIIAHCCNTLPQHR